MLWTVLKVGTRKIAIFNKVGHRQLKIRRRDDIDEGGSSFGFLNL